MNYFILDAELGGPYCALFTPPDEITKLRRPAIGVEATSTWPTDPRFKMESSVPGLVVPDFIANAMSYLMISGRARALFEDVVPDPIEYLPFKIVNHKGAELEETYFVANVMAAVPAVDVAISQGRPDALNPEFFDLFRDLHLDHAQIPPERRMFRLSVFPQKILIHEAVKEEIERRKLTAAVFTPPTGRIR